MKGKACVASDVVSSERFMALSEGARLLYFYLCFSVDADGVIKNAFTAKCLAGAGDAELQELLQSRFLYSVGGAGEGVYLLAHQWLHNVKNNRDAPAAEWAEYIEESFALRRYEYIPREEADFSRADTLTYERFRYEHDRGKGRGGASAPEPAQLP